MIIIIIIIRGGYNNRILYTLIDGIDINRWYVKLRVVVKNSKF